MRFQLSTLLAITSATCTLAAPSWGSFEQWSQSPQGKPAPQHTSPRPDVQCHPKTPQKPHPAPPPRRKTCYVKSHNNGTDDSPAFLAALHECNNGGHVVLSEGVKYTIGTALDLTFLSHIDIGRMHRFLSEPSLM
jgi:galacturan 1,4-alpha-galacturonidase